ncbi:MAG: hypothetical protein Fur0022_07820 [Anaerolineales bacterium]
MPKHITVFGASQPKPGDPDYEQAKYLGTLLAQAGYTILTGGYMGTMEAVSRGAAEAGGHTIGVTCEEIETWRKAKANPWVKEEWKKVTLKDRLHTLVEACDAALALPGGIGTLAEIAIYWSNLQVGILSPRPLILIGSGWRATFETMLEAQAAYIHPAYRTLVSFAKDVGEAFQMLKTSL